MSLGRNQADDHHAPAPAVGAGDDARLLARVAMGDRRAFEALYRIYHPPLSRFLTGLLRRPHLVEEALNDTMMVVWRRPDSFNGTSKVSTWIFAIAYRTALKARSGYQDPLEDQEADLRASPDAGPEQQVGHRQTRETLSSAIDRLSADHRAVVDLTYFHEVGYRDIAEIMNCPVGTVKTRMHHARLHLKTMLAGQLADWL
jgi:RNA polymerase sigma-70 factor (ECF subfamily)